MNYSGKVALVTGGTGDLGSAMVKRLRAEGLRVAFTFHRRKDEAHALCQACGPEQTRAWALEEISLPAAWRVVDGIRQEWETLDYLVNNLGGIRDRAFYRMEEDDWHEVIKINLDAAYAFSRAMLFECMKRKQGAVVNISSVTALLGTVGQANYAAAKAGMIGLTRALAREAGKMGVRVNAIAPGYIVSAMTERLPSAVKNHVRQWIPMGKFGQPEDVAGAVAFLLAEEANYINGQTLTVDGGLAM